MLRVRHSLVINEPVEIVFQALSNFEAEARWQSVVLETKLDPQGPVQIGTKTIQKRKFSGKTITTIGEIIEFDPGRRIVSRSTPDNPPPAFEIIYEIEPEGQASRVTYTIELRSRGIFNLIAPLIKETLKRDVTTRFETLKGILETRHSL